MAPSNVFALRITLLVLSFLTLGSFATKRGLVYKAGTHDLIQNWNGPGSQINWAYNWDSAMEGEFPQYMEYIPMLWGTASGPSGQGDHVSLLFTGSQY